MKTLPRLVLGFVASCLLCVGLVRAADHLDPLSHSTSISSESLMPTTPCTAPCLDDGGN